MPRAIDPKIKIKKFAEEMKELKKRIIFLEKISKILHKEIVKLSKQTKPSALKRKAVTKEKTT